MAVDLNLVDSVTQASPTDLLDIDDTFIERDTLHDINESIKDQYIDFKKLGVDLISHESKKYKIVMGMLA